MNWSDSWIRITLTFSSDYNRILALVRLLIYIFIIICLIIQYSIKCSIKTKRAWSTAHKCNNNRWKCMKTRLLNIISIQINLITLILTKAREVAIMANSNLIIDFRESRILLPRMVIMVLSRIQRIPLRKVMARQYKERMHRRNHLGTQRLLIWKGPNLPRTLPHRQNSQIYRVHSTKVRWEANIYRATALAGNNMVKMESNRRHSHQVELYSMNMGKMER